MAAFSDDDLAAFLLGVKTPCESSNIDWAKWDSDTQELILGFKGGSICVYPHIHPSMAEDFARAESKGRWKDRVLVKPKWPFRYLVKRVGKHG